MKIGIWPEKQVLLVHIREYYCDYGGQQKPGKKGIALTMNQWKRLFKNMQDIDDDVKEVYESMYSDTDSSFISGTGSLSGQELLERNNNTHGQTTSYYGSYRRGGQG